MILDKMRYFSVILEHMASLLTNQLLRASSHAGVTLSYFALLLNQSEIIIAR